MRFCKGCWSCIKPCGREQSGIILGTNSRLDWSSMSSVIITLRMHKMQWELVSPSGVILTTFREKYPNKAKEYALAWISTWSNWTLRIDNEVRMPKEVSECPRRFGRRTGIARGAH